LRAGQGIFIAEPPKAHAIDVFNPKVGWIVAVVNGKRLFTLAAEVSVATALLAILNCFVAATPRTNLVPFFLSCFKFLSF
jgi:hypothetical protein